MGPSFLSSFCETFAGRGMDLEINLSLSLSLPFSGLAGAGKTCARAGCAGRVARERHWKDFEFTIYVEFCKCVFESA